MLRRTSSRASSRYGSCGTRQGLPVRATLPTPASTGAARARVIQPPTPTESQRLARRLAEVSAAAVMVHAATHTPVARYTTFNAMWHSGMPSNSASFTAKRTARRSLSGSHVARGALRPTSSLQSPHRPMDTTATAPSSLADQLPSSPYRCTIDQVLPAPSNLTGFRVPADVDDEPSNEHLRAVVELLVDPDAVGIEDVRLADFSAMTPRRQLRAVGSDKECLEVVLGSEQYQACKDARALRLAGIRTIGEWHERADRVPISAYSRGVLEQAYQRIIYRQPPVGGAAGGGGQEAEVMAWLTRTIQKAVAAELVGGVAHGAGLGVPLLQATANTVPDASMPPAHTDDATAVEAAVVDVVEEEGTMELEDNDDGTVTITESIRETVPHKKYAYTTTTHEPAELDEMPEEELVMHDDEGRDVPIWKGDIDVTGMKPVPKKHKKHHHQQQAQKQQEEIVEAHDEEAEADVSTAPMDAEDKELDAEIERLLQETDEERNAPAPARAASGSHKPAAPRKPSHAKAAAAAAAEELEEEPVMEAEEMEEIEEVEEVVVEEDEEAELAPAEVVAPVKHAGKHAPASASTSSNSPAASAALSPAKEAKLVRLAELMLTQVNSADGYLHMPVADLKADIKDGAVEEVAEDTCQVSPLTLFSAYHAAPINPAVDGAHFPPEVVALKSIWDHYNTHQTALEEAETSGDVAAAEFHTVKSVEALVQGALWLRCISREEAVSLDAQQALPPFGFPLLSSDTRAFNAKRPRSSPYTTVSAQDVLEAADAYKAFFRQKKELRFTPFRPSIDCNAGSNVVMLSGSTLHLYDTSLKSDIQEDQVRLPFAESMLGVLHILRDCHVLPRGVNTVHYHILVTQLPSAASTDTDMMLSGATIVSVDLTGPFSTADKKRLMALAEPLGMAAEMEEFECVEDIVRQIRETTSVNVIHDLLQNRDELEAMLTPTLVQLLPEDAESAEADETQEEAPLVEAPVDEEAADAVEEVEVVEEEEEVEVVEEVEEVVEEEDEQEPVAPPVSNRRRPTPPAPAPAARRPAPRKATPPPPVEPELDEEHALEEVEEEEVEEIIEVEEEEEEVEVAAPPPPQPSARRRTTAATPAPAPSRWNLQEDTAPVAEDEDEVEDEEVPVAVPRTMARHVRPAPASPPKRAPVTAPPAQTSASRLPEKKPVHARPAVITRRVPPQPSVEEELEMEAPEESAPPQQWFNRKMKAKRKIVK